MGTSISYFRGRLYLRFFQNWQPDDSIFFLSSFNFIFIFNPYIYDLHNIIKYLNILMFQKPFFVLFAALAFTASAFQINTDDGPTPAQNQLQAIPWPFTTCGDGDWTIQSLTMDQVPKRNINDNIIATGTATNSITFKKADILVKLNGAFLDKQTAEFANSYDAGDSIEFVYANYVPSFAPIGNYNLQFQFIDSKDKINGCLQFQFKL